MDVLEGIWDFVWFFFWTFAFIAYLMVLFSIIGDLFRDHELGGFAKAVWLLFLLFLPFITALVYVIARGQGMSERQIKMMQRQQEYETQRIRSIAGASSADEISKAASLYQSGAITAEEYESLKEKALH
ncbi:SHOCT domain-containing protein [Arthrobacter sp. L77]|uniref:SHOCT domain-containing protein n=1 Tax=Arthrobacter sp. L77 TaxID=1496689 RepID=UPI0005BA679B|nr:SHOCT domain-containing protein [Arthrobacter sp. L77]